MEKSEDITVIIIFPANVFYGSTGQIFTPGALGCLMTGKIIFLNGKCIIGTLGDLGYIGKAVGNYLFLTAVVCGLFGLKRHRNWTICSPIQPFISLLFYRFWNDIIFQPTVTSILYADLHHSHPTTFPARKDQSHFFPISLCLFSVTCHPLQHPTSFLTLWHYITNCWHHLTSVLKPCGQGRTENPLAISSASVLKKNVTSYICGQIHIPIKYSDAKLPGSSS